VATAMASGQNCSGAPEKARFTAEHARAFVANECVTLMRRLQLRLDFDSYDTFAAKMLRDPMTSTFDLFMLETQHLSHLTRSTSTPNLIILRLSLSRVMKLE